MAETIEINISTNAQEMTPKVNGLRQEIRELRKELDKLPEGSEEYGRTFSELAEKMHTLSDQQYLLRNSAGDLGTVFQNMQTVTSQVVAGFGALTAVESMLGVSTEDTQKAMLKMQQTMALVQGLKGLEGMGKSVKGLVASFKAASAGAKGFKLSMAGIKTAIASTGIGLLVIALGELIAHWDDLSSAILGTNKKLAIIEESFEADKKAIEEHSSALDFDVKKMEAAGASSVDCAKQRLENSKAILAETEALIAKNKAQIAELQANSTWYNHHKKEIKALREQQEELVTKQADAIAAVTAAEQNLTLAQIRENKKRQDSARSAADARVKQSKADADKARANANKMADDLIAKAEAYRKEMASPVELLKDTLDELRTEFDKAQDPLDLSTSLEDSQNLTDSYITDVTAAIHEFRESIKPTNTELKDIMGLETNGSKKLAEYYDGLIEETNLYYEKVKDMKVEGFDGPVLSENWLKERISLLQGAKAKEVLKVMNEEKDILVSSISTTLSDVNKEIDQLYQTSEADDRGSIWSRFFSWDQTNDYDNYTTALDLRIEAAQKYYNQLEMISMMGYDVTKEMEEAKTELILLENDKRVAAADKASKIQSSSMEATANLMGALGDVFEQAAEKYKDANGNMTEEGEKMLKASRAMKVTEAVINMLSGVVTAVSTAMQLGPIAGPIVGAINSAAVIATGVANIAKIKSANENTTADAASGGASANIITQLSSDAYESQLSNQTTADINEVSQNTKVYVTTTDINKKSDSVKAAVATSSF